MTDGEKMVFAVAFVRALEETQGTAPHLRKIFAKHRKAAENAAIAVDMLRESLGPKEPKQYPPDLTTRRVAAMLDLELGDFGEWCESERGH